MASIILTGATGTVGSAVLTHALSSPSVSKVTVLARRAPAIEHAKLETILVPSDNYPAGFSEFPASLLDRLRERGASAVVWALGVSQRDVPRDEYEKITYEYTMASATALRQLGSHDKPFKYVFVSGMGADQREQGGWFQALFAKVKGRAERELVAMENEGGDIKVVNLRPGGIIPTEEHAHNVPLSTRLQLRVFGTLLPSMMIKASDLATAAVQLATSDAEWDKRDKREYWIDNAGLNDIARRYAQQMEG